MSLKLRQRAARIRELMEEEEEHDFLWRLRGELVGHDEDYMERLLHPRASGSPSRDRKEERYERIRALFAEERRTFSSQFANNPDSPTQSNTLYVASNKPASEMIEVRMLYEPEAYYFWLDLEQTMLEAAETWLRVQ
ncbi:MAG: hypothetical protein Q9187_004767 [Circinaria calcarea]